MKSISKLLSLFTRRERRNLAMLLVAVIAMAFLEVAMVGSIAPFVTVATNPEGIADSRVLSALFDWFGFEDAQSFLVAFGIGVFAFVILANTYTAVTMYWVYRYAGMRNHSLSLRLFKHYLYQPYTFFLDHNTSNLSTGILSEVNQLVNNVLRPGMEAVSRGLVAVAVIGFLAVQEPLVALIVLALLGGGYGAVFWAMRLVLHRIGHERAEANRERFQTAAEAFGSLKVLKSQGKEPVFERLFSSAARRFAWKNSQFQILTVLPKYVIEAIALGMVALAVVFLVRRGDSFAGAAPLIATYAFAGFRLLPALQTVFRGGSQLRVSLPVIDRLSADLHTGLADAEGSEERAIGLSASKDARLEFSDAIRLEDVRFRFPSARADVLTDISIEIPKHKTIGLVGPTGSGKTTLVDLLLGLLEPDDGRLLVDSTAVSRDNIRNWQLNLGYVPQQVFIADASVASNIAFGVLPKKIDQLAVERAARIAHLHEFVMNELPDGYDTVVGERGIRLSGGQRQRIGIARALYHDPEVVILDEATSALDNVTERSVMDALSQLMGLKTLVIIAHRISTVENADVIYRLEGGRIAAAGAFASLIANDAGFRQLARSE